MKKKILLLTDFSPAALNAIQYAQRLFEGMAVDFHLVNAYRVEPDLLNPDLYVAEFAQRNSEQQLTQLLSRVSAEALSPSFTYQTRACVGSPLEVAEILQTKEHYDFVVAGSTTTDAYAWQGTMATGLIRRIKTNILIVPEVFPLNPIQHILLASDYHTFNDINNLQTVKDLARLKHARLTLLKVFNEPAGSDELPGEKDASRHQFLAFFEGVSSDFYFIREQDAAKGITDYLAVHPVELLVTVPHHTSFWDALNGRSLTRKLVFHTSVPLLALYDPAVPDKSEIDPESQYRATIL